MNSVVRKIVIDPGNGAIYVGGDFTSVSGLARSYLAKIEGSELETCFPIVGSRTKVSVVCL